MKMKNPRLIATVPLVLFTCINGAFAGSNYFVPMAWCVVSGSPAQAIHSVGTDNTTHDIIWRRHERPTDNIYLKPSQNTGISFRSGLTNPTTFPSLNDVDTVAKQAGDVLSPEPCTTTGSDCVTEVRELFQSCDAAWASLQPTLAGITAVNVGLFHDNSVPPNYLSILGWGGCTELNVPGTCGPAADHRIIVADNYYQYPNPPNPWPGGAAQFAYSDQQGQAEGHELGHALGVSSHNTANTQYLMNSVQQDNNSDGFADNITLETVEKNRVKSNAITVPSTMVDPPGKFDPPQVIARRVVDALHERKDLPGFLDLASVKVTLDQKEGQIYISQQLRGLLPKTFADSGHWYLVDFDKPDIGATAEMLAKIGVPSTGFRGADLVINFTIKGGKASALSVWRNFDGQLKKVLPNHDFEPMIGTFVMYPHYAPIRDLKTNKIVYPDRKARGTSIYSDVVLKITQEESGIEYGNQFRVQALISQPGKGVVDDLKEKDEEEGATFVLENPKFPLCYPQTTPRPGETVPVKLEYLKPNSPIHGLIGPNLVFQGKTDSIGGGTINLPIPKETREGQHLVTVGVDGTAFTADCVVEVKK